MQSVLSKGHCNTVGALVLVEVYFLSLFPAGSEDVKLLTGTGTGTVITEA